MSEIQCRLNAFGLGLSAYFVVLATYAGELYSNRQIDTHISRQSDLASLYEQGPRYSVASVRDKYDQRVVDFIASVEKARQFSGDVNSERLMIIWEATRNEYFRPDLAVQILQISTQGVSLPVKYGLMYNFLKPGALGDPKSLSSSRMWKGKEVGNNAAGSIYAAMNVPPWFFESANGFIQLQSDLSYIYKDVTSGTCKLIDCIHRTYSGKNGARLFSDHFPGQDDLLGRMQVDASYQRKQIQMSQSRIQNVLSLVGGSNRRSSSNPTAMSAGTSANPNHAQDQSKHGNNDYWESWAPGRDKDGDSENNKPVPPPQLPSSTPEQQAPPPQPEQQAPTPQPEPPQDSPPVLVLP